MRKPMLVKLICKTKQRTQKSKQFLCGSIVVAACIVEVCSWFENTSFLVHDGDVCWEYSACDFEYHERLCLLFVKQIIRTLNKDCVNKQNKNTTGIVCSTCKQLLNHNNEKYMYLRYLNRDLMYNKCMTYINKDKNLSYII